LEAYSTEWLVAPGLRRPCADQRLLIRRYGRRLIAAVLVGRSLFLGSDVGKTNTFLAVWHEKFASFITRGR
jgi:hypothetical protein